MLFVGGVTRGSPRVSHVSRKRWRLVPGLTNVSDRLGAYWSETEARFMSANDSRHVIYSGLSGTRAYWLSIYAALPAIVIIYWVKVKFFFFPPRRRVHSDFLSLSAAASCLSTFDTWQMHRVEEARIYRKKLRLLIWQEISCRSIVDFEMTRFTDINSLLKHYLGPVLLSSLYVTHLNTLHFLKFDK